MVRTAYSAVSAGVLVLVLAACGGTATPPDAGSATTTEQSSSDESSSEELETETFTEPETEDPNTTEDGGDAEEAGGEIELPGLPIGGFWNPDFDSRCVVVNWSGPPDVVPGEVILEVTSLTVSPVDLYTVHDGECQEFDLQPCLFNPGVLADNGQCEVLVRQTAASPDGTGTLSFDTGVLTCAAGAEAVCEQFVAAVAEGGDAEDITWDDAIRDGDWPTNGSSTDTTSSTGDDLSESTG